MFKIATAGLLATLAQAETVGVPPNKNGCKTPTTTPITSAWGLVRDYDMGGCKCADPTASWGFGDSGKLGNDQVWACYCDLPNQYASQVDSLELSSDKNNRACGVIQKCQSAAVEQQKKLWQGEIKRIRQDRKETMKLNDKQLVKESELNEVRHVRKNRSKQNNMRARIALQVLADEYKQVKFAFVSGDITKAAMTTAHAEAAQQVTTIRSKWSKTQGQIDQYYENAVARTITMENFVDQDQSRVDKYFLDATSAVNQRYGNRIQEFMMIPIITHTAKALLAQTPANCPLLQ